MTPMEQGSAYQKYGNILIVGVAGVGKSTLGRLAGERLGMECIDVEHCFYRNFAEQHNNKSAQLGTLDRLLGREAVNEAVLNLALETIRHSTNSIIVTSTRCLPYPEFWETAHSHGVSLHLHGMGGEVYERRCSRFKRLQRKRAEKSRKDATELGLSPRKIYFHWDHARKTSLCLQANYQVRIRGEEEKDISAVTAKILAIRSFLQTGGLPNQGPPQFGLGFSPATGNCRHPSEFMDESIPEWLSYPRWLHLPDLR